MFRMCAHKKCNNFVMRGFRRCRNCIRGIEPEEEQGEEE